MTWLYVDQGWMSACNTALFTIRDMAVRARQTVDGGFAWVVLFAIFCVMVLLGIMQYSAGVLNTAILEEIDNDLSKTSWVGSTMLGTLTLTGPVAGLITKALGYRASCFAGGILMLIGFTAASFVNDVTGLILTFGVIAGFGNGLAFNACYVVPGYYFIKRRGLAYGVTVSGIAVGMFITGPLCQLLMDTYNLHGCLLVMGALLSNICVAASLLKPMSAMDNNSQNENVEFESFTCTEGCATINDPMCGGVHENTSNIKTVQPNEYTVKRMLIPPAGSSFGHDHCVIRDHNSPDIGCVLNDTIHDETELQVRHGSHKHGDVKMDALIPLCRTEEHQSSTDTVVSKYSRLSRCFGRMKIRNIPNKYGLICFCFSYFFWFLGEGTGLFHLPNYAKYKGSTQNEASSLFTAMGFTSVASRLLVGFAASDLSVGYLTLHMGLLGIAGLLALFFPLFSNSYALQMVFSGAYGMYTGGLNSLVSPLTIQLVGLEHLAVAFGIENFCCGVALFIGPPLASFIFSQTGRYELTYVFSGTSLLTAAICGGLVGMCTNKTCTRSQQSTGPIHLQPVTPPQEQHLTDV
ncbi:monocarboxylate transporter 5-like isoform X1 [Haliotis rufescens]|uniref:monocarboxylate transporter 5-like isoform X1 n=2 Tax=Haliotis rufescens TaxID=6454 RepID=UPI00201F7BAE|nr:monocarboxylate transporter 5-like isoform X1 [Haliotis rufescens]